MFVETERLEYPPSEISVHPLIPSFPNSVHTSNASSVSNLSLSLRLQSSVLSGLEEQQAATDDNVQ